MLTDIVLSETVFVPVTAVVLEELPGGVEEHSAPCCAAASMATPIRVADV